MPRFYINFRKGTQIAEDDEGQDLPGLEEAKAAALVSAREILADNIKWNADTLLEAVIIADEQRRELATIPAKDVLPEPLKSRLSCNGLQGDGFLLGVLSARSSTSYTQDVQHCSTVCEPRTMKMVAEYLEHALNFERMAAREANPEIKALFEKQAAAYRKLAAERTKQSGLADPKDT